MLIVSKIQREGGSRITVDGQDYFFEPNEKTGQHMCEVNNAAHAKRLLAIPEGFEPFDPSEAKDIMPPTIKTPEKALEEAIEPAADLEQAEEGDDDPEATLENNVEPDQDDGLEQMSKLDLSHAYKDEFGKAPPANMKRDTMINRIRKAQAEG